MLIGLLASQWLRLYAQPLPAFAIDRRSDSAYMDSVAHLARHQYQLSLTKPATPSNDTLRFETLYYLGSLYRYRWGDSRGDSRRDSTLYFADVLIRQAHAQRNLKYEVLGILLREYYYHNLKNNYPLALQQNYQARALLENARQDPQLRWRIDLNLSDLYSLAGNYQQALQLLKNAEERLNKGSGLSEQATLSNRAYIQQKMGIIYNEQQKFTESEYYFLAAKAIVEEGQSETARGYVYDDLGELYLKYKRYDQALHYAKKAEAIWRRIRPGTQSNSWGTLASIYLGLGQETLAYDYAQKVIALPKPTIYIQEQAYRTLYQYFEHRQDWEKSSQYYKKYIAVRDSITYVQHRNGLASLQKQAELDQFLLQTKQERQLQANRLMLVQKEAELNQLRADAQVEIQSKKAFLAEKRHLLEKERVQRTQQSLLRQQAINQLVRLNFARESEQEYQIRLWLLSGLVLLLVFVLALALSHRRNRRQKRLIERMNTSLEQTVQARTTDLVIANKELHQLNQAIYNMNERIIETQEAERQRIAADLHDELGGTLSTLRLRLMNLRPHLEPAGILELEALQPLIHKSYADLRRISHNLMPPEFARMGLRNAVEQLVQNQPSRPTRFSYFISGDEQRFSLDTELNVYRIVSEMIQNINKHARASQASVQLLYYPDKLSILIEDDGLGNQIELPSDEPMGIGLKSSRLRAEYIGAALWWDVGEGGTLVVLEIPYPHVDYAARKSISDSTD